MITVEEAKALVFSNVHSLGTEQLPIHYCVGRVLAADAISKIDMPPFNQSAMDGYAVCGLDQSAYEQVGEVKAGDGHNPQLLPGQCVRIFTGAPVPDSADAVVMQERTMVEGLKLKVEGEVKDRENIRPQGEQIRTGEVGMSAGTVVSPGGVGFLATLGYHEVSVHIAPRVAIVATGSELVEPGAGLVRGQIYESNSFTLLAALSDVGISAIKANATDTYETTRAVLGELLEQNDVLIITGGISVGDYDFVGRALLDLGVEQVFHKVAQKPGKPVFFGKKDDRVVFALPGNPAASLTCYYEYVYPAIRKMMGYSDFQLRKETMTLANDAFCKGPRACFLKARVQDGRVEALNAQSSAMMSSFAAANAIIYATLEVQELKAGDVVEVHLLPHY